MRFVGGAGSGPGNFGPGSNAPVVPVPVPRAANAPNLINFTGVPEGMAGNQYYGQGLSQIEQQRQALVQAAGFPLAAVKEPFGGAAYVLDKLGQRMSDSSALSAEQATRERLASIMGGIDLNAGPTAEQIQAAYAADPSFGEKLYAQAVAARGKEHWVDLGNGLQRNSVTGETKTTGEKTTGPGALKPSDMNSMYNNVQGDPTYKTMETVSPIYTSMINAMNDTGGPDGTPSKASDLDLVYGLATLLDPGSVVRESDSVMVQNAQSLPGWLLGLVNQANGGTGLGEGRAQIMDVAYSRAKAHADQYNSFADSYAKYVRQMGGDPDVIIRRFDPIEKWKPQEKPDDTGGGGDPVIDSFPAPEGTPEGDVYTDPKDKSVWVNHGGKYQRQQQ